jgi:hypothetical protein
MLHALQAAPPGARWGLVPCAVGGTFLAKHWGTDAAPHPKLDEAETNLFSLMLQRAAAALAAAPPGSALAALVWYVPPAPPPP